MDIYKLFFVLTQIFALIFLTVSVLKRNKELHAKFVARVKLRLVQMNLEGNQGQRIEDLELTLTERDINALHLKKVLKGLVREEKEADDSNVESAQKKLKISS